MKKHMTVKETAAYTNFAPQTIYNLVSTQKIPFKRISPKKVLFDKGEIDKWLFERNKEQQPEGKEKSLAEKDALISERILKSRKKANFLQLFRPRGQKKLTYVVPMTLMFLVGWAACFYFYQLKRGSENPSPEIVARKLSENLKLDLLKDDTEIRDINVVPTSLDMNEVQIKLGHLSNVEFKGEAHSDLIMPFLLYVLKSEKENYATKSKTIDVVKPYVDDEKIRTVLIQLMKNDKNPSIRMKSLAILSKVAQSDEVKEAILDRLIHDGDETLRFRALEALESIVDAKILSALLQVKREDGSEIVRNRAELICRKNWTKIPGGKKI